MKIEDAGRVPGVLQGGTMSKRRIGQVTFLAVMLFLTFALTLTAMGEDVECVLPFCWADAVGSLPSENATVVAFKSISFGPGEWEISVLDNGCIRYHASHCFSNVAVVLQDGATLTRCYLECSNVYVCNGVVHLPPTDFLTQIGPFSDAFTEWVYALETDIGTWLDTFDTTGNCALALDGVAATLAVQIEKVAELPPTEAKIATTAVQDLVLAVDDARDSVQTELRTYSANVLGLQVEDIEHVTVCALPTTLMEQTELLVPPYELVAFWETMPPEEVLSRLNEGCEGQLNVELANAAVCVAPLPSEEWCVAVWDVVREEITYGLSSLFLPLKLLKLVLKYGEAIIDCYRHFPDWNKIDDCLVNDYGLARNVVKRILDALKDP